MSVENIAPRSTRREISVTERASWKALLKHHQTIGAVHLRQLFDEDPHRGDRFCVEGCGVYLDYSKNRVTAETVRLLLSLAVECGLPERIEAFFGGVRINLTENRSALHTALRAPATERIVVDGVDVVCAVHETLESMAELSNQVRKGEWRGYSGKPIRNVINIGIGGSDLGPVMAHESLRYYSQRDLTFCFVSNVDGTDFDEATRDLEPDETLFIICSKTFTTIETLANARAARAWIVQRLGDDQAVSRHFVAVSSNEEGVTQFGIDPANRFELADWVGGRYSMGSSIGLSTMIAIGPKNFRAMLAGFREMDDHYRHTPFEHNLPVLMGLLAVWNCNFLGAQTVAVLPYAQSLKFFPAYLQQLSMESNGKRVTRDGIGIDYQTGPIVWGERGTNGQHSFYQFLHQGTQIVPCDFIGFCQAVNSLVDHHDLLMSNLFAQSEALAFGKTMEEVTAEGAAPWLAPHRVCDGNRPSNTLLADRLTPGTLGRLIAVYEHSVFTQGVIWDIDSFDQWGVELGKALSERTARELESRGEPSLMHDSSTNALIHRYRRLRGGHS